MREKLSTADLRRFDGVYTDLSTFSTFVTGLTHKQTTINVHDCKRTDSDQQISRLGVKILAVWSCDNSRENFGYDFGPPGPWLAFKCETEDEGVQYLLALKHKGCLCEGTPKDNILIRTLGGCGYGDFENIALQALNGGIRIFN
jgi:hypothetical protein